MTGLHVTADDLLRGRALQRPSDAGTHGVARSLALMLIGGMVYGAVMGAFAGPGGAPRPLQMVYSASKVPLLLLVTFAISLPSFFVLNTLLGVREDFRAVLEALVATQACLTIILASLAPFTALWYLSFDDYEQAVLFNAAMLGVSSVAAQFVLRRTYRELIARRPAHRHLFRIWLIVFAFVGIQMAWVLRPFVGNPGRPTTFFREGAWGNAYIELARIAGGAFN